MTSMNNSFEREPFIVWGLFLLCFALVSDSIIRSDWVKKSTDKNKRRSAGMVPVVVFFGLFGWWIYGRTRSSVHPAILLPVSVPASVPEHFSDVYRKYGARLGNPIGEETATNGGTYTAYEHAEEIWIPASKTHYYLYDNSTWEGVPQPENVSNDWVTLKKLHIIFKDIPAGREPFGGTAILWYQNPDKWKHDLGLRNWHCEFTADFHYMEFEKGIVVGMVPKVKRAELPSQILTLINGSQWYTDFPSSGEPAPMCKNMPEISDDK